MNVPTPQHLAFFFRIEIKYNTRNGESSITKRILPNDFQVFLFGFPGGLDSSVAFPRFPLPTPSQTVTTGIHLQTVDGLVAVHRPNLSIEEINELLVKMLKKNERRLQSWWANLFLVALLVQSPIKAVANEPWRMREITLIHPSYEPAAKYPVVSFHCRSSIQPFHL